MRRRASALLATACAAATSLALEPSPSAEGTERLFLRAELGAEYDTNAQRTEVVGSGGPPVVASPLARAVVTAQLSDQIAPGHDIALGAMAGGKLFTKTDARSEDVAVASTSAQYRARLGARASAGLAGFYYEAFQRGVDNVTLAAAGQRADFRSLLPMARLGHALGDGGELVLTAGYRAVVFKPNHDYSFGAPLAALDLRWLTESTDATVDWELGAGIGFEPRFFDGAALVAGTCQAGMPNQTCAPVPNDAGTKRADQLYTGHAELTRTGTILLGAGYAVQWNHSNSVGETVQRHFISLRLTAPLPLGFYLATRGDLLIARYADPVVLAAIAMNSYYLDIDRENRSSVRA
ncbi:MAG TPA: hypothetical protein VMU50_22355, partial [Polyangia bacterium]|nr:hypothetical protein [Polyangia bacterium]